MSLQTELLLAQSASFFDLSSVEGRGWSHQALVNLFLEMQDFIRPKTFIEVGAFDAWFSREIRTRIPSSKSFAFEANTHNFNAFSRANDYEGLGIDYRHMAISNSAGQITFNLIKKRGGEDAPAIKGDDSILKRRQDGVYGEVEYEPVVVDTASLDGLFSESEFGTDDFSLWVDVEGASEMVFSGARKLLTRTRSIFIEVEEKAYWSNQWLLKDLLSFLGDFGFHCVARDFENAHQFNVIFVHESVTKHFMFSDRMVNYFNAIGRRSR